MCAQPNPNPQPAPQGDFDSEQMARMFARPRGQQPINYCQHREGQMLHPAAYGEAYCHRHRHLYNPLIQATKAMTRDGNKMMRKMAKDRQNFDKAQSIFGQYVTVATDHMNASVAQFNGLLQLARSMEAVNTGIANAQHIPQHARASAYGNAPAPPVQPQQPIFANANAQQPWPMPPIFAAIMQHAAQANAMALLAPDNDEMAEE